MLPLIKHLEFILMDKQELQLHLWQWVLISLCQLLYLHQISGFGVKAAEIPWQMERNRCPVVGVWVEGWVLALSVGATVAGQPLHGLAVHLQMGKLEVKCFKVFVPATLRGQAVGDLALAHR